MRSEISRYAARITRKLSIILPIAALTLVLLWLVQPSMHAQAQHSITVAWTASTTPAVTYNVYRGIVAGGPYTKQNATPLSVLTYTDTNGTGGTKYFYVVRAFDGIVESVNSNEANAIFLGNPQPPAGVTALAQ